MECAPYVPRAQTSCPLNRLHRTLQMLDCCRPLEDVKQAGITLTHAACLSRCNGARVDLHRYGTFSLEDLRRQVGLEENDTIPNLQQYTLHHPFGQLLQLGFE